MNPYQLRLLSMLASSMPYVEFRHKPRPFWPSRPRIAKYSRKAWRKRRQGKGGAA